MTVALRPCRTIVACRRVHRSAADRRVRDRSAPRSRAACSPPSTTSASPSPTSTRPSRSTRALRPDAASTRRSTRTRASARRCSPSATPAPALQLLAPLSPESTIAKFLDRNGPGIQQMAYRVTDIDAVCAHPARAAACACCTTSRARARRQPHQLRAPEGRRRRPRRAGRARRRALIQARGTDSCPARGTCFPPVTSPQTTCTTDAKDPQCSTSSTPSCPATAPPRRTRTSSSPRPTGASPSTRTRQNMFEGVATRDKDPRKSLHLDDVPLPELGPGRGPRRGHGQRDQLQHRVDLDLRAGLDVRLPRALRPALGVLEAPRPALPRGRLRPRRRRAAHGPGRQQPGSPARRSSRTACRSSSRAPTATTTR